MQAMPVSDPAVANLTAVAKLKGDGRGLVSCRTVNEEAFRRGHRPDVVGLENQIVSTKGEDAGRPKDKALKTVRCFIRIKWGSPMNRAVRASRMFE